MFARASCSCLVFPSSYGAATSWERGEGPHHHSQTMFSVSAIPPPLLPLPVPRTWSCCCQLEKLPPIYFPLIHIYIRSFSNYNRLVFLKFYGKTYSWQMQCLSTPRTNADFFFAPLEPLSIVIIIGGCRCRCRCRCCCFGSSPIVPTRSDMMIKQRWLGR